MPVPLSFLTPEDRIRLSSDEFSLLERSYTFAHDAHDGQKRKTGEPYFLHPYEVAQTLWWQFKDIELTCAGFLHDVIEDCPQILREEMYTQFGDTIGFLVDAVTKSHRDFYTKPEIAFDKVEKILWAGMRDIRVIALKLADRENNVRTLQALKSEKQIRIAFETHAIYEPLSTLVGYEKPNVSLKKMETSLWNQVPKEWSKDPHAFKDFLLDISLEHFDTTLFDYIYTDSNSPMWSITDWDTYARITTDPELCENIKFITVKGNQDNFAASFQFKGAALIKGAKFNISGYRGKGN